VKKKARSVHRQLVLACRARHGSGGGEHRANFLFGVMFNQLVANMRRDSWRAILQFRAVATWVHEGFNIEKTILVQRSHSCSWENEWTPCTKQPRDRRRSPSMPKILFSHAQSHLALQKGSHSKNVQSDKRRTQIYLQ